MDTTLETTTRELDRRCSDGITVRLLWNSGTNEVSIAVQDDRGGESFRFGVPARDALEAFRHPYAYVTHSHVADALPA